MPVLAPPLLILVSSIFPEAESPLPDRIGLAGAIAWAGAGGVVGGIAFFKAPASKRDRAVRWGGLLGFTAAAGLYFVALLSRVLSV